MLGFYMASRRKMRARARALRHFWHMAKPAQRNAAMTLFVEQNKTRKEIAELLNVRENTVGKWVSDGKWEELRTQQLTSSANIVLNLKKLISTLAEKRLAMERDPNADPAEKARISDEISKQGKVLSEVKGEGDITLNSRLHNLEWVMGLLRKRLPQLHNELVDFHMECIEEAARLHA